MSWVTAEPDFMLTMVAFYDPGFLQVGDILAKDLGGYSTHTWDERTGNWSRYAHPRGW